MATPWLYRVARSNQERHDFAMPLNNTTIAERKSRNVHFEKLESTMVFVCASFYNSYETEVQSPPLGGDCKPARIFVVLHRINLKTI